jgi:hypothetical protein
MRCKRLRLLDDAVGRSPERRTAEHRAARGVRAAAERHRVGVALDKADVLERNAEPVGHELRVGGGVPLAVAVRAGHDRHHAARIEAQLHALIEHARVLQVIDEGAAAKLSLFFRFSFSG